MRVLFCVVLVVMVTAVSTLASAGLFVAMDVEFNVLSGMMANPVAWLIAAGLVLGPVRLALLWVDEAELSGRWRRRRGGA